MYTCSSLQYTTLKSIYTPYIYYVYYVHTMYVYICSNRQWHSNSQQYTTLKSEKDPSYNMPYLLVNERDIYEVNSKAVKLK
jgi:hypothetical protein